MKKKMIPYDKQKLVYIKWEDAHSNSNKLTDASLQKEIEEEECICEECGWVVYEDKHEICFVQKRIKWPLCEVHQYEDYMMIPKTWLLEIQEIVG